MRTFAWCFVLLAGCSTTPPSIELDCAVGTQCQNGTLGVGGIVSYLLYRDDHLVQPSRLIALNDGVVQMRVEADVPQIVGIAPGTSELAMLDDNGAIVARRTITVGDIELHLVSPMISGSNVPAGRSIPITIDPEVGGARSIGSHYFQVSLDGAPYDCWGTDTRYCTGPVFYENVPLDPLDPGDHTLAFHSLDGGRDWSFTLTAR
ncbi:MAG: hypothetical protein JO257_16370 [Deltaproteobacteria bacterium]|nr:hypothetical protein [Deltaproteobacteria bacterium]